MANEVREGTDRTNDAERIMTGDPKPVATADNRSRTSSDMPARRKNVSAENAVIIDEGQLYREKNGDLEVIPFFVDLATARVRFSPVGRSTEDQMRMGEFLNRFEKVDKSRMAEATPAESQKDAEARMKRRETTDQLGRVVMKDGKPV